MTGSTCYIKTNELIALQKEAVRWWTYHGELRSIQLKKKTYAKRLFAEPDDLGAFIEEYRKAGGTRAPSNFADAWEIITPSRRNCRTLRAGFPSHVYGNWQAKFQTPIESAQEYDIVSAYASACLAPLPRSGDAYRVFSVELDKPGIYYGIFDPSDDYAPSWFYGGKATWATSEEIFNFHLRPWRVAWGYRFYSTVDYRPTLDAVREKFTAYKKVFRSFWGRWAAAQGPQDCTPSNPQGRTLPNPWRDTVKANFITSRIRSRLREFAPRSYWVFADQVVTRERIPVGENIGDWKLKREIVFGKETA